MNKLQAMEVFVQVVDCGSFTKAADALQLPKATVSTLVQSLETTLSAKLLHRTTRQVTVTSDGAAYYERCVRILSDVRDAEESLSRHRLSPSGRLRVDAPTGLSSEILVPALPDFFARYPDITIELGSSDRPVDLVEEGVDCAVRGGELVDLSLIARRVGVVTFVTCAAPSYIEAGLSGQGIIFMAVYLLTGHLATGRAVRLLPEWRSDPLPVHIVYPQNRHLSAKVRVFVEWISELFAAHPNLRLQAPRPSVQPALETV